MKVNSLFNLSFFQIIVFTYIFLWLVLVKGMLFFMKVKTVKNILSIVERIKIKKNTNLKKLLTSLRIAERRFFQNNCLTVALVGRMVLAQFYFETKLHIGARLDNKKDLNAHAWLSYDDKYIVAGLKSELGHFKEFKGMDL